MELYHDGQMSTIRWTDDSIDVYGNPAISEPHTTSSKGSKQRHQPPLVIPHSSRKKTVPCSLQTMRSIRKPARLLDPESTPGETYFLSLTFGDGVTPQTLKAALTKFAARLTRLKVTWFYVLEWEWHQASPHVHMIANATTPDFPQAAIKHWLKVIPYAADLRDKQDCRRVETGTARNVLGYMAKGKTKAYDFNLKAKASGADWSGITPHGCSQGWQYLAEEKSVVTDKVGKVCRRWLVGLQSARGIEGTAIRGRGKTDLMKAITSSVCYFSARLSREEDKRKLLTHASRLVNDRANADEREEERLGIDCSHAAVTRRKNHPGLMRTLRRIRVEMDRRKRRDLYGLHC